MALRVLIVDSGQHALDAAIDSSPGFSVVGSTRLGALVLRQVERLRPDVVTIDLTQSPDAALATIQQLARAVSIPVIALCAQDDRDLGAAALLAGAMTVVEAPADPKSPDYDAQLRELRLALELIADVPVSIPKPERPAPRPSPPPDKKPSRPRPAIIAIGASAGGPAALRTILSELPGDFGVPIVIVQHLSDGFGGDLAEQLDRFSPLNVRLARQGEKLQSGTALIAPEGFHLRVNTRRRVLLDPNRGGYRHHPSVNVTLTSVAETFGPKAIGVILTGMGDDGAEGLSVMRRKGAQTIVQDEASCVVFGMPAEAIARGAAEKIEPLKAIADVIMEWCGIR
jgi:two-component system chemotaxis response regulator CheB